MGRYTGLSGSINPLDNRDIDSRYDNVEAVANNITDVTTVADNITPVSTVATNIADILAVMTAANNISNLVVNVVMLDVTQPATAQLVGNVLTLSLPRGATGLSGADGDDGLSAYDIWKALGNTGSEESFIASLKGSIGDTGASIQNIKHVKSIHISSNAEHFEIPAGTIGYADIYNIYSDEESTHVIGSFKVSNCSDPYQVPADQVKTLYESNADTNAFTDADKASLNMLVVASTIATVASSVVFTPYNALSSTSVQAAIQELADIVAGKAAEVHTHVEADITDLDKYTQAEVDNLLDAKFDKTGGTVSGTTTFTSDVFFNGGSTEVNTETVTTADNLIVINDGEVGDGITAGEAGFEVDRGLRDNYFFKYVEATKTFRIGKEASLQAVATREDNPLPNGTPYWDDTLKEFITTENVETVSIGIGDKGLTYDSGAFVPATAQGVATTGGFADIGSSTYPFNSGTFNSLNVADEITLNSRTITSDRAVLDAIGTEADFLAALNYK